MDRLIQTIERIRQKLPILRRNSLKETPTRTIVIDPLLEALGWDIRDPDEVQLEYPTIDSKSVDYALKLNKKPVLLVEAKALEDSLDDVKAITQVVGYAANDGIVWCILTNGIKWRVYRSMEKCAAPDKLMYEVSIEPDDSGGLTLEQIAKQLWRFSAEEMVKGTLDTLGEETFTDGKVRKALGNLLTDPPRVLLNLIRSVTGDNNLAPARIKDSLLRIASESSADGHQSQARQTSSNDLSTKPEGGRSRGAKKAWATRRTKKGESLYDELFHLNRKPQEAIELYRAFERLCSSFSFSSITKRFLKCYISFEYENHSFCNVFILRAGLRVWLPLKYSRIDNPPVFARDVSSIGHHGNGDVELQISNRDELDIAASLIRKSFEALSSKSL
jgi:predicted transport protein